MAQPVSTAPVITFDDEFNRFTSSPDGAQGWMTTYPYGGDAARTLGGNNEAQYYSDSSVGRNPFSLAHGVLSITATNAASGSNPGNLPYDSGLITTYKSFAQTYGIFEVRAQLPAGQGLWPAFWLLPSSGAYSSELDVFEQLGNDPSTIYATVHGSKDGNWSSNMHTVHMADTSAGFHTYKVDWEPKTTSFFVDGKLVASAPTPSSMNQPMYMLLNLAVGGAGSWPGAAAAGSIPATMKIDWVRAYATANTTHISGTQAVLPPLHGTPVSPSTVMLVHPSAVTPVSRSTVMLVHPSAVTPVPRSTVMLVHPLQGMPVSPSTVMLVHPPAVQPSVDDWSLGSVVAPQGNASGAALHGVSMTETEQPAAGAGLGSGLHHIAPGLQHPILTPSYHGHS